MSTRCQLQVVQEGIGYTEKVTLYHHTDGYPSNMLMLIWKAYHFIQPRRIGRLGDDPGKLLNPDWQHGRTGKAAGFLCAADPGVMEPEAGHSLHGDIEYYYRIHVINRQSGSMAEVPIWKVEVLKPTPAFWESSRPTKKHLKVIIPLTDIDKMVGATGAVYEEFDK